MIILLGKFYVQPFHWKVTSNWAYVKLYHHILVKFPFDWQQQDSNPQPLSL